MEINNTAESRSPLKAAITSHPNGIDAHTVHKPATTYTNGSTSKHPPDLPESDDFVQVPLEAIAYGMTDYTAREFSNVLEM